jgi:hypothetical protein
MTQFRAVQDPVLTTGCDDAYRDIAQITWPNHQEYATKHGLQFWPSHWTHDFGYSPSWSRLWDIKQALDRGAPYVICLDTDAVFVDMDADWEALLDPFRSWPNVWVAYEVQDHQIFPSLGLMIVKNDIIGRAWIDTLWNKRWDYEFHPWCEQAVAYELLGFSTEHMGPSWDRPPRKHTAWSSSVAFLPQSWMSTPQSPASMPVIYHATNLPHADRIIQLRQALRSATLGNQPEQAEQ